MKKIPQKIIGLIFTFISLFFGLILLLTGILTPLENKFYDHRINVISSFSTPSQDICFIGIDQQSIDRGIEIGANGWPWPRENYGKIIQYLKEGNASNIIFDVFFTEQSVFGSSDDELFANACKEFSKVGQTMFALEDESQKALFPIESLKNSANIIGTITSSSDKDGTIRRARISQFYEEKEYPALGLTPLLIDSDEKDSDLQKIKKSIPLRKDNTVLLKFKGNINRYAHYSAIDILNSWKDFQEGKEPLIHPSNFEGATVFFLFYAPGLYDICSTPISKVYPGAGVHITLLDNYLQNDFIKEVPLWVNILFIFICAFIGARSILFTNNNISYTRTIIINSLFFVLTPLIIFVIGYGLFYFNYFIQILVPLLSFCLSFLFSIFYNYATEGKKRKFIKAAFTQYLSPSVINQLLQNPEKLKLGGEKRRISIFFSDIQGFTSISESLSPEMLTVFLNKYLSEMSNIILKNGGTIDKYEGDAIIAFWNAPIDTQNHERKAIETAVLCQERLKQLQTEFMQYTNKPVLTRIGVNTGYAVVGNMGSDKRFDYTMFGDSVNFASRLEGINKDFGTFVLCSKETANFAKKQGSSLYFKKIANVKVVGKNNAVEIFLPLKKEEANKNKENILHFYKALELFNYGDFINAKQLFEKLNDVTSKKYAEKCDYLIKNPPSEWKGEWQATSK